MKCAWTGCPDDAGATSNYCASHLPGDPRNWRKRKSDGGVLCWVALRAGQFWDFVDGRQMDCWAVTAFTLVVTWKVTSWSMAFAIDGDRPGLEVAAILAAVNAPWALLQAACVKFVFDARKCSFSGGG